MTHRIVLLFTDIVISLASIPADAALTGLQDDQTPFQATIITPKALGERPLKGISWQRQPWACCMTAVRVYHETMRRLNKDMRTVRGKDSPVIFFYDQDGKQIFREQFFSVPINYVVALALAREHAG